MGVDVEALHLEAAQQVLEELVRGLEQEVRRNQLQRRAHRAVDRHVLLRSEPVALRRRSAAKERALETQQRWRLLHELQEPIAPNARDRKVIHI